MDVCTEVTLSRGTDNVTCHPDEAIPDEAIRTGFLPPAIESAERGISHSQHIYVQTHETAGGISYLWSSPRVLSCKGKAEDE